VANASSTGVFIAESSSGHQVPPAQKAEDKQIKNSQNFTQEQWKAFEDVEQMELLDEIRRLKRVVEEEMERSSEERDRSNALQEQLAAELTEQKNLHRRDVEDLEQSVSKAIRENERLSGLFNELLTCVASNGKTIDEACFVSGDTGSGLYTADESFDTSGDTGSAGNLRSSTCKAGVPHQTDMSELHRRRRPDDAALALSTPVDAAVHSKKSVLEAAEAAVKQAEAMVQRQRESLSKKHVLKASTERPQIARKALSSVSTLMPRFKSAPNQKEPECDTTGPCKEGNEDPDGREENMENMEIEVGRKSWGTMGSDGSRRDSDDEWDCISIPR
jgi:hypothetical protein